MSSRERGERVDGETNYEYNEGNATCVSELSSASLTWVVASVS